MISPRAMFRQRGRWSTPAGTRYGLTLPDPLNLASVDLDRPAIAFQDVDELILVVTVRDVVPTVAHDEGVVRFVVDVGHLDRAERPGSGHEAFLRYGKLGHGQQLLVGRGSPQPARPTGQFCSGVSRSAFSRAASAVLG